MYSAPAVSYPVDRSLIQIVATAGIWLAGAGVWLVWLAGADGAGWRHGLSLVVLVLTGAAAAVTWLQTPTGQLRWDLANWVWTGSDSVASGKLVAHLDFQAFLLLTHVSDAGEQRWLWLERKTDPGQWMALRRALYAHHRSTTFGTTHQGAQETHRPLSADAGRS